MTPARAVAKETITTLDQTLSRIEIPCTLYENPHVQTSRQLGRGVHNFGHKSPYTNIAGQLSWGVHNLDKKNPVYKHVMPVWLESPQLWTKVAVPKHTDAN